jgi:hypothetical protein
MGLPIQRPAQGLRKSNVVSFTPGAPATNATLQGWKEIAAELARSVRTVQRWQQKLGLPVHKLGEGVGCPVFAFKDELRSWLRIKAGEGMGTRIDRSPKAASIIEDEPSFGRGRNNSGSRATPSEPEIIKSLNAFFALKGANNNAHLCNHCHASTHLLVGNFWLYGTEKTWQVSVPFCPDCDSELRAMLPQAPVRLT